MRKDFKALGLVSLALTIALTGCTSTAGEQAGTGEKPNTNWRETTQQEEINPDRQFHVDQTSTSRQDGPREVKFISKNVKQIDKASGKEVKKDLESIFELEVKEVNKTGATTTAEVYSLETSAKNKKKATPVVKSLTEELDIYTLKVSSKFVSGFSDFSQGQYASEYPLLWPISDNGALSFIDYSSPVLDFSKDSNDITLTAYVAKDAPAPTGVRYVQFGSNFKAMSSIIDVFPKGQVSIDKKSEYSKKDVSSNKEKDETVEDKKDEAKQD